MKTLLCTLLLGLTTLVTPVSADWLLQHDAGFSKSLSPSMPHVHRIGPRDAIPCARAALQARMRELMGAGNTGLVASEVIAGGRMNWELVRIDGFPSELRVRRLITPDIQTRSTRC